MRKLFMIAESRKNYTASAADLYGLNTDELQTGCLMRIADSLEKLVELQYQKREVDRLKRANAALRKKLKAQRA